MVVLHLFIVLASLLVICKGGNLTERCRNAKAFSYLEVAVDMIRKAKENYPECPDAKSTLSSKPVDCEEWLLTGYNKSGSYKIWPKSRVLNVTSLDVYCDMETDGGGWTVIQRRGRPKGYFSQDWSKQLQMSGYKEGFGPIEQDFWLGNDNIFALTNQKLYSVRFDLKDVDGEKRFALYDTFWIDDEIHKYILHIHDYSGDAEDFMGERNNMQLSPKDADNDIQKVQQSAQLFKGGWWYGGFHSAYLNGLHLRGKQESFADGVKRKSWKDYQASLDTTEMKIRSKDFKQKSVAE